MATTAIVVNYNAGDLLGQCVLDLVNGKEQPRIWVVDNASTDGSAEKLKNLYAASSPVKVMFNPSNLGFGPAVNAAVAQVDSEYLLVINPDCRINADTLGLLRAALVDDKDAALAGPLVRNPAGAPERATLRRFPTPLRSLMTVTGLWRLERWLPAFAGVEVNPDTVEGRTVRAEAVSGACMLIRRSSMAAVGGFDESYALHCEDLDLMFRLRQSGQHCLFVSAAEATHFKGVSSRSRPLWVHWQKHRGMVRFFAKHQSSAHVFPVRWLVYSGIFLHYLLLLPLVLIRR